MDHGVLLNAYASFLGYLAKVPAIILVVGGGILVISLLNKTVRRAMKIARLEKTLINVVAGLLSFGCWVFLISLIFSMLGFPHISLIFSGSISLVIVGVASNAGHMIQDLLAGVFLIADSDFKVGSFVRVNGIVGKIVAMDIKKTKLRDSAGAIHVVANRVFDSTTYIIETPNRVKRIKVS